MNTINHRPIAAVYSGKAGKCCCGCAGTHSTRPATVTRIIAAITDNARPIKQGNHYSRIIGDRIYVAYTR